MFEKVSHERREIKVKAEDWFAFRVLPSNAAFETGLHDSIAQKFGNN